MGSLLIIWDFCSTVVVIHSCGNSTLYFHRWQGWLVFDYLTSWGWPGRKAHKTFIYLIQNFIKIFGIWIPAWKPGPLGQLGLMSNLLVFHWGCFAQEKSCHHAQPFIDFAPNIPLSNENSDSASQKSQERQYKPLPPFLQSDNGLCYSNKCMFLYPIQWGQKCMPEWREEARG